MLQTKVDMGREPQERSEAELRPAEIAAVEAGASLRAFSLLARDLATAAPTIAPETTGAKVLDLFRSNSALPLVAVTDANGVVYGTVERDRLLSVFAQPLWFDVYFKRSVLALMNRQPLIVDESTPLDEIKRLITADYPGAIQAGFLVTRQGRFSGIGTMEKLLELTVEQTQRRMVQLDEARHAAEFAASSRARFLATMSHELRTPLYAIIGFSDVIQREVFGAVGNATYRGYINDIHASGQQLLDLLGGIIDLSAVESGRVEVKHEAVAPTDILHDCRAISEAMAAEREHRLTIVDDAGKPCWADRRLLRQVLLNLVSNAAKYTRKGGDIEIATQEADGMVIFSVTDNGVGMSAEEIERAVQPFTRLGDTMRAEVGGSGIGLALVKRLVETMRGRLDIESEPGRGTRVTVSMPSAA